MSAYMLNSETLAKIAGYLSRAIAANRTNNPEMNGIEATNALVDNFRSLIDESGHIEPSVCFGYLYEMNEGALDERYGDGADEMKGTPQAMPECNIDTTKENRKEWLSNLYTVCRCYLYQISEGNITKTPFYQEFSRWVAKMAAELAKYVVDEVRPRFPKPGTEWKPWDVF